MKRAIKTLSVMVMVFALAAMVGTEAQAGKPRRNKVDALIHTGENYAIKGGTFTAYKYFKKALKISPTNKRAIHDIKWVNCDIVTTIGGGLSVRCDDHYVNGVITDDCGSFVATFTNETLRKVKAPFTTCLNTHVAAILKQKGYKMTTGLDVSVAFVKYIKDSIEEAWPKYFIMAWNKGKPDMLERNKYIFTAAMLSKMVNDGQIIPFSLLVDNFVQDVVLKGGKM